MLYKWRHHQRGGEQWEPEFSFSQPNQSTTPRDYLTREERQKIRDAALEYGSVPSRENVYGEERDRWRAYLAKRFGKPKSQITEDDWKRANSWKIPSLVWTSLDAGLRPIEVKRARTSWVDVENGLLRIPSKESSKNEENWRTSIQDRTATMLDRWLEQRKVNEKYDDTDSLWLTSFGNPYASESLRNLLHRLCDTADIDYENRSMSWYSIRHSTGTYMAREEDLAAAQTQLRHRDPKSTMRYDQTPPENRQDALDRMG